MHHITVRCFLWPPCVADADIIFLSCGFFCLLSIYLLFFLAYSQPSQTGCLPYFHTWCGLGVNLGCRSETWCTRLAENTGCKKSSKIRHLRTIVQLYGAISSQLKLGTHCPCPRAVSTVHGPWTRPVDTGIVCTEFKACIDNWKKTC